MKEKLKTLSIKLPESEMNYIKKEAEERGISIAKYVRQMCNTVKYKSEIDWDKNKSSS